MYTFYARRRLHSVGKPPVDVAGAKLRNRGAFCTPSAITRGGLTIIVRPGEYESKRSTITKKKNSIKKKNY